MYAGDTFHRAVTDSSKAACVAVRAGPGTGPVALDDFYQGAPGDTIADVSPGLMLNDVFGIGQITHGATRHAALERHASGRAQP